MKSGKLQQAKGVAILRRKNSVNNWLHNPNNYLRSSSNVASLFKREHERSCSSEKEHKMNALAPRADEGRDNLR